MRLLDAVARAPDNWRLGAKPAQRRFVTLRPPIRGSEPVTGRLRRAVRQCAPPAAAGRAVVELSHDDAWMRDVGPTFVVNDRGGLRGVDWHFNAWGGLTGGLYFPWNQDDAVAQKVIEIEGRDRYRAPFVLEGGAIHVDGQGTLITTEECLLNPIAIRTCRAQEIETLLKRYLGVEVVWFGYGVYDDETDGHVDNLVRYVRPASSC
jgi:agmatine deiminase